MIQKWRQRIIPVISVSCALIFAAIWSIQHVSAATGSMYITPASNSVQNGNTFTVSLRINPGTTVDGIEASIQFDTSKLQYVSHDTSSSAFSAQLQQSISGGTISIARGDFSGGISADALIERITFKAVAGSGSSTINLASANASSGGAYTNPSRSGAAVNFTSPPAATCPAGQTGTPPNCVTPTTPTNPSNPTTPSPTNPTPSPTTPTNPSNPTTPTRGTDTPPVNTSSNGTKPKITEIKPSVQFTKAIVVVKSDVPTRTFIKYGLNEELGINTAVSELATEHAISFDPALIVPGQTYYYRIVTTDNDGNTTEGDIQTLKTKGMSLKILVLDKNKNPIRNKTVILYSNPQSVKTDKDGYATLSDVIPGTHHLKYSAGGKEYSQEISVANNIQLVDDVESAAVQNFSVLYNVEQRSLVIVWYAVALLLVGVIVVMGYRIKGKSRYADHHNLHAVIAGSAGHAQSFTATNPTNNTAIPSQPTVSTDVKNNRGVTADRLHTINNPSMPAPGTTISPKSSEDREQS